MKTEQKFLLLDVLSEKSVYTYLEFLGGALHKILFPSSVTSICPEYLYPTNLKLLKFTIEKLLKSGSFS